MKCLFCNFIFFLSQAATQLSIHLYYIYCGLQSGGGKTPFILSYNEGDRVEEDCP